MNMSVMVDTTAECIYLSFCWVRVESENDKEHRAVLVHVETGRDDCRRLNMDVICFGLSDENKKVTKEKLGVNKLIYCL